MQDWKEILYEQTKHLESVFLNEEQMRTYRISYYTEHNDECVNYETEVEAAGIYDALITFESGTIYKRIHKVEELPTMTLERRIELKVNEGNDVWIPYAQISQSLRDFWIEYFKK